MPRLTIYVPDDVADEVQARKEQINVSQVCSQALRAEVGRLRMMEETDLTVDVQALAERLREQRRDSVARSAEAGRRAAIEWLNEAAYDEIRDVAGSTQWVMRGRPGGTRNVVGEYTDGAEAEAVWDDVPAPVQSRESKIADALAEDGVRPDREVYRQAWLAQVKRTWEAVKDQI
jgi:hypothetical protein